MLSVRRRGSACVPTVISYIGLVTVIPLPPLLLLLPPGIDAEGSSYVPIAAPETLAVRISMSNRASCRFRRDAPSANTAIPTRNNSAKRPPTTTPTKADAFSGGSGDESSRSESTMLALPPHGFAVDDKLVEDEAEAEAEEEHPP